MRSQSSAPSHTTNNNGAIAGGVVGGVVAVALLITMGFWLLKRRQRQQQKHPVSKPNMEGQAAAPYQVSSVELGPPMVVAELPAGSRPVRPEMGA